MLRKSAIIIFFFNDTATTEIYTLSLHDALPIYSRQSVLAYPFAFVFLLVGDAGYIGRIQDGDRKSTRLNSSHTVISYAVFCLKKKRLLKSNLSHRYIIIILRSLL